MSVALAELIQKDVEPKKIYPLTSFNDLLEIESSSRPDLQAIVDWLEVEVDDWRQDRPLLGVGEVDHDSGLITVDDTLLARSEVWRLLGSIGAENNELLAAIHGDNGSMVKTRSSGFITAKSVIKEAIDPLVYAAHVGRNLRKVVDLSREDRSLEYPDWIDKVSYGEPAEYALTQSLSLVEKSFLCSYGLRQTTDWYLRDFSFFIRLSLSYVVSQGWNPAEEIQQVIKENSYNYPLSLFGHKFFNYLCAISSYNREKLIFFRDHLSQGVKEMRYYPSKSGKGSVLDVFNMYNNGNRDYYSTMSALKSIVDNYPDISQLREAVSKFEHVNWPKY